MALVARKDLTEETIVSGGWTRKPSTETPVGVKLWAEGDIAVLSGGTGPDQGNLFAAGAVIESNNGQVTLLAARDMSIAHDITTDRTYDHFYQVKRSWFSRRVTEELKTSVDETVQPSVISGRSVSLRAGGQLDVVASAVLADGAVGLHADGDLNLLSAAENDLTYSSRTVRKSGLFGNGGLSITIGSKSSTTVSGFEQQLQHGSSVGSIAGDILATAGGQYLQLSSDISAPQGDISIAAANVALRSAPDTTSVLNLVRETQSGITLGASHAVVEAAKSTNDMLKLVRRTDNGRYRALGLMTAGLTIYNAYRNPDTLSVADPLLGKGWGGWSINASVGSSVSEFESITKTSTPVSSAIDAGRHVSINATGAAPDSGDVTMVAARISAGGDMRVTAQRDITLGAAAGSSTDATRQHASSGAVGVNFGGNGLAVTVAASRSNGWSNGWGTTFWNTELATGGRLDLSSGRDTTLTGAKAGGNTVVALVGTSGAGNLTIASPLDESHYRAREQSTGLNLSVPVPGMGVGAPSLGLSASSLALLADYESVREQSAINAGTGGFNISVNGHTHLRGGAITTEGDRTASVLNTQTFTHEDLQNQDVVQGRAWSIGLQVGSLGQNYGPLALSTAGYARIDTNLRSNTASSVGGNINLTRPDLQAGHVAAMKAAQRDPLASRLVEVQQELTWLYANPPPCSSCLVTGDTLRAAAPATGAPVSSGPVSVQDGDPEWLAWQAEVRALEAERGRLQQRIAVIDATQYGNNSNINLSPSVLHQPLLQTFDRTKATQELRDGVAVTAAFGKAAYKWAGDYADTKRKDAERLCSNPAACPEADRWKEGGAYRMALHMAVGGMSFGTAGATGNLAGGLMLNAMDQAITALGITDPTVISLLKNTAVTMAGAGTGGTAGAASAFNADANNRQLHPTEIAIIKSQAQEFARRTTGHSSPTQTEVDEAERRLAQEAFRLVQFGTPPVADQAAQQFLRGFNVLLPGDSTIAGGQSVGYAFYATPYQRANPNMYAAAVVDDPTALDFYIKNHITQPTASQAAAAIGRYQTGFELTASLTKLSGLVAGGLSVAPMAPYAITACLANITLCGISAAELGAGAQLGPTGMGIGNLAQRAGVSRVLSAEAANLEWIAARPGNVAAWTNGTAVVQATVEQGTTLRMYVNASQAQRIQSGDLSALGGWATFDAPVTSINQMRNNMALSEAFKPSSTGPFYVIEFEVKRPMPANIGFVAPQTDAATAAVGSVKYGGGGTQIQLLDYQNRGSYLQPRSAPKCVPGSGC